MVIVAGSSEVCFADCLLGAKGGGDEKQGGNCGLEPPNTSHGNDSATPPATGQDRQRCRNKERRMSSPHPTPDPIHAGRLARLRAVLKARGLAGFVIPTSDEPMSEYVGAYAQRLAWLPGVGGTAGTTAVLHGAAAIFVDGGDKVPAE